MAAGSRTPAPTCRNSYDAAWTGLHASHAERRLAQLPRYLKAAAHRLGCQRPPAATAITWRSCRADERLEGLSDRSGRTRKSSGVPIPLDVENCGALFAQQRQSVPVSGKRLARQWDKVRMGNGIRHERGARDGPLRAAGCPQTFADGDLLEPINAPFTP